CSLFFSYFFFYSHRHHRALLSFPTRRSSDLKFVDLTVFISVFCTFQKGVSPHPGLHLGAAFRTAGDHFRGDTQILVNGWIHGVRSEEHTSELQSRFDLVCRLLLEKKKKRNDE